LGFNSGSKVEDISQVLKSPGFGWWEGKNFLGLMKYIMKIFKS